MKTSEQINEIATALAQVQGNLQNSRLSATNPFHKNRYSTLADVLEVFREAFSQNGLAVVQSPQFCEGRILLTTRIFHKSGQWFENELSMKIVKDDAQGIGSLITYGRRYALSSMIGIAPGESEDDDGNESSNIPKFAKSNLEDKLNGSSPAPTGLESFVKLVSQCPDLQKLEGLKSIGGSFTGAEHVKAVEVWKNRHAILSKKGNPPLETNK